MKHRFLIYLTLCLTAISTVSTASAQDILVLESLISNHKSISNRLRERNNIESAVWGGTYSTQYQSGEYQDILEKLNKKYRGGMTWAFAADVAALTSLGYKAINSMNKAVDSGLDLVGQYPYVLDFGWQLVNRIGNEIADIVLLAGMAITGDTGVMLASNEQRMQFMFIVRSKLERIINFSTQFAELCFFLKYFGQKGGGSLEDASDNVKDYLLSDEASRKAYQQVKY